MINNFGILAHILNTNIVVKLVLLILAFFSLTSWAIIFYKLNYFNKAKKENKEFIDIFWESKRLDYVMSTAKNLDFSPIASMFESAYKELVSLKQIAAEYKDKSSIEYDTKMNGSHLIERVLKKSQLSSISKLEMYLPFLATTGSISPFIGLFGTVWGIMTAFESIQKAGTAGLAVVAPGIADSLVATAAGLFAAIPAVIAYNYYTNRVRVLANETDDFAYEFMAIVEKQILKD